MSYSATDLKKITEEQKIAIGTDESVKALKLGKVSEILLASNCAENVKADIEHYAQLSGTTVTVLGSPNDELGMICKKPFSIAVIAILKGE